MTRPQQAQRMQQYLRHAAETYMTHSGQFNDWMCEVLSAGGLVSPEVAQALGAWEKIMRSSAEKLLKEAGRLEAFTLELSHDRADVYAELI